MLQADGYGGFEGLYEGGRVAEAACWAHVRRLFYDLHLTGQAPLATEALRRIGLLFELKKGNSPAHHYSAIGQLFAYSRFFNITDAVLVAVLEADARVDFRPAFRELGIELVEFTRRPGEQVRFIGLDVLMEKVKKKAAAKGAAAIAKGRGVALMPQVGRP